MLQARRILFDIFSSLIVLASSVGMFFLERGAKGSQIRDFGISIWFCANQLLNAGVPVAPVIAEGRFLALLVTSYGFAIFGVITAALASLFVEID